MHGDLQPPEHGTVLTNPLHSSSEVETWQSKKFSLQCPSSANLLSTDWHKRKESAKPHDLRSIKPLFKEAVRRLSLVTEQTDLLRKKEIPWSLVLLTLIHITSSIPWIFILVSQDSIGMIASESGRVWLDLGNALLLCSVAISPLLYVLFTRLIRDKVWQIIKNMFKAMFGIWLKKYCLVWTWMTWKNFRHLFLISQWFTSQFSIFFRLIEYYSKVFN